jgi:2-octaprenyl-6-methoxyphenol hydroxylase
MQAQATMARVDIVISGGSYVGLSLALALEHELGSGVRIAVVDRAAGPAAASSGNVGDPRASAISAGSVNLLRAIGIWDRVVDAAVPVDNIELTDSSLHASARRPLLTYENRTGHGEPASWILPNGRLAAALEAAVASHASIERIAGVSVVGFTADGARASTTLDDGRVLQSQLAIAADGRRSGLREAAGIRTVGWDYGQTGIVTTISHELDHRNHAVQHFLPSGPFALLPLQGGHRSCITWSETTEQAKRILALDDRAFLEEVDLRVAGRLGAVTLDGPRRSWPLEAHLARSYVGPRLALVGDAAHGVHPIGGQGLNLGFRDVAALAECLNDVARVGLGLGDADALARYERWRRFDSALSSAAYSGLNRVFSNDMTLVRSAREFGLGLLDRLPVVKRLLVEEAAGLSGELPKLLRSSNAA